MCIDVTMVGQIHVDLPYHSDVNTQIAQPQLGVIIVFLGHPSWDIHSVSPLVLQHYVNTSFEICMGGGGIVVLQRYYMLYGITVKCYMM